MWIVQSIVHTYMSVYMYVCICQDELAHSVTLEQGKTLADAIGDVTRGLREFLCCCVCLSVCMYVCVCVCVYGLALTKTPFSKSN